MIVQVPLATLVTVVLPSFELIEQTAGVCTASFTASPELVVAVTVPVPGYVTLGTAKLIVCVFRAALAIPEKPKTTMPTNRHEKLNLLVILKFLRIEFVSLR
jgi:hypothetical protein